MIPEDPYGEIQMLVSALPDSASTIVAKSKEFRKAGDVDFAFELLQRAIDKDPAPAMREEYADLLFSEGRTDEALVEARKCLEEDPSRRHGRTVLRKALVDGLPETARSLVDTALEFDDESFTEELLLAGVQEEPDNLVLLEQLARFYAMQRKVSSLIATLQSILEVDPEHGEALLMLAGAHLKEGDLPRAQKILDKARRQGVDSPRIEDLERKIADVVSVISEAQKS